MNGIAATLALLAAVCFALAATLWQKAALGFGGISIRHRDDRARACERGG
jgi:hypothetical protein